MRVTSKGTFKNWCASQVFLLSFLQVKVQVSVEMLRLATDVTLSLNTQGERMTKPQTYRLLIPNAPTQYHLRDFL